MSQRISHPLITPARLMLKAIVYTRQSSEPQVKKNWGSTQVQFNQADCARAYGWPDSQIQTIDEDLGRSATSTTHRSGWKEMLRLITSGIVGAVFVWNVSRLSRELRDFEELRVLAKMYDVVLVIDGRPADPKDPSDTVLLQVQAVFAQHDNHARARMMSRARREKAKRGTVVSRLPIGWIKLPDGSYDFDPEVRAAIDDIIQTFWRERSVLGTVRSLARAGKLLPVRYGRRIDENTVVWRTDWKRPSARTVRQIITHPSYAGFYVFNRSENRPDLGMKSSGYAVRRPLPEDQWIKVAGHHPAYMSAADQERAKELLKANRFEARSRPRNGAALCQRLLHCARCGVSLSVNYPRRSTFRYQCQRNQTTLADRRCFNFAGKDLDAAVERTFLSVLTTPPRDMLQRALAESRAAERAHAARTDAELKRLRYEEQLARDRYHECDPRNRLVAAFAEDQFNRAMQARLDFEQRLASEPARPPVEGTEEEIRELCEIAQRLLDLWQHPVVTHQDRKQLLQCLIRRINVEVTDESVDATIEWASGAHTPLRVWLRAGWHRLIRERHAAGLTVPEICAWLAHGDPNTGQQWDLTRSHIYSLLKKWGLTPNAASRRRKATRALVA